jgi:curli production protein
MLVPAEQDIILSKTTIMAGPQDAYQVWLRLLDDQGAPISDDSLRYSPASAGQ